MGFSRQEYWSGLPCSPAGGIPNPEIKPRLLHLLPWQVGSLPLVPPGKALCYRQTSFYCTSLCCTSQASLFFFLTKWSFVATLQHWASLLVPFSIIYSFSVLYHIFSNSYNISNLFITIMFIMVISDLWCYYYNSLKIQMMATSFCSSVAKSCPRLCDPVDCSTPGLPVPHYLLEFAQVHVHWINDAIQPPRRLPPSSPFAFNLSQHQDLFQWVISSHWWPKYWSFSFSINPSNEYSGLISFQSDWFDPLAVQGTLKSILQPHSSKTSILWCSVFFMVQLLHPYITTGKTIALTRWSFVSKVMPLLLKYCLGLS